MNPLRTKIILGIVSVGIVSLLTPLVIHNPDSYFLICLLFPGEVISIIITGPHGGTKMENMLGDTIGFVTNCSVYYFVLWLSLYLISKLLNKHHRT
jgi:hypothetical protein